MVLDCKGLQVYQVSQVLLVFQVTLVLEVSLALKVTQGIQDRLENQDGQVNKASLGYQVDQDSLDRRVNLEQMASLEEMVHLVCIIIHNTSMSYLLHILKCIYAHYPINHILTD